MTRMTRMTLHEIISRWRPLNFVALANGSREYRNVIRVIRDIRVIEVQLVQTIEGASSTNAMALDRS